MQDDLPDPGATAGLLAHHGIEGLEQELRDAFGGDGVDDERTEKLRVILEQLLADRVRLGEEAGMVEAVTLVAAAVSSPFAFFVDTAITNRPFLL